MKTQLILIFALIFALFIGIFAVINVNPVAVNFLFGTAHIPLILVILGSTLVGALIVGLLGIIRQYRLQRNIRQLEKHVEGLLEKSPTLTVTAENQNGKNTAQSENAEKPHEVEQKMKQTDEKATNDNGTIEESKG